MLTLISVRKISNFKLGHNGFSLVEILVALVLASLVLLTFTSNPSGQLHRDLQSAISDLERAINFAGNESILRNSIVRLRVDLEKNPIEYNVEYGPSGNFALPEISSDKTFKSLADEKIESEKISSLNKQFTKVEEFEKIRHELSPDVNVIGIGTSFQGDLINEGDASIYFYPTGEKDGAIIFLSTDSEIAWIEVQPFLSENQVVFETLNTESIAKKEDILQTRMEEVYKEWNSR